jgi:hypothetical protein
VDPRDLIIPTFEQAPWDYEVSPYLPIFGQHADVLFAQSFPESQDLVPRVDGPCNTYHNALMLPYGDDDAPHILLDEEVEIIEESRKETKSEVSNSPWNRCYPNTAINLLRPG